MPLSVACAPDSPGQTRLRAGVEISHGKSMCPWIRPRRIYLLDVPMSMGIAVHCPLTHIAPALYPVSVRRV